MDGSITYTDQDGNQVEEFLQTFSVEEQEENLINKANAKLVFSPKYVVIDTALLDMGLKMTEAYIYSFISFYTSNTRGRFYFTDEQLAKVARCSPKTASRAVQTLKRMKLIDASLKMRAGGGKIRFVKLKGQNDPLRRVKMTLSKGQNDPKINNKIKDNKINNIYIYAQKDKMTDKEFNEFWEAYPRKRGKKRAKVLYLKLDRDKHDTILSALAAAKESDDWQRGGGQYIPYPATWIYGERWEDEIETEVSDPGAKFRVYTK